MIDWQQIDQELDEVLREWRERTARAGRGRVITPYLLSLMERRAEQEMRDKDAVAFVLFDSLGNEGPSKVKDGIE